MKRFEILIEDFNRHGSVKMSASGLRESDPTVQARVTELGAQGWSVKAMTHNGVSSWSIIFEREIPESP